MNFIAEPTKTIAAFLTEIGLAVIPARWPGCEDAAAFLPGIKVERGQLLVDEAKLPYPGDLLHEAGHLAVLPRAVRAIAVGALADTDADTEAMEAAAIAWSYAAVTFLRLDPAIVFHPHGYRGKGSAILFGYRLGVYPGVGPLAAVGMTAVGEQARQRGVAPFPHMLRWLRD